MFNENRHIKQINSLVEQDGDALETELLTTTTIKNKIGQSDLGTRRTATTNPLLQSTP